MIQAPRVHAMKPAFEKCFLRKGRHGYVRLREVSTISAPQLRSPLHDGPAARHSASQARSRRRSRARGASPLDASTSELMISHVATAPRQMSPAITR